MKAKFTRTTIIKIVFIVALFCAIFGCTKDIPGVVSPSQGNLSPTDPQPAYLDVTLAGPIENSPGSGYINFQQGPDLLTINIEVAHLEPNHSYILEFAADPITDAGGCSGTPWLVLGRGLTPQTIYTDTNGKGEAGLWQNVTSVRSGTSFHIHFQVVDSATMTPVLASGCYEYTVG